MAPTMATPIRATSTPIRIAPMPVQGVLLAQSRSAEYLSLQATIADFTPHNLWYLAVLRIYVSSSWTTVSRECVRNFGGQSPVVLTPKTCKNVFAQLQDRAHPSWMRAAAMNRDNPGHLRNLLMNLKMRRSMWKRDLITPVGNHSRLRPSH